ncbi:UbiA family prenyltransferase [Rhizobium mulingense]|uniref:UbiA family prenyltransferase n=1 Tax=Rhizobium mulingense TaxID=3031128 RepID=UPI002B47A36E|nr:UbiA family prenyltransferase [Rhizobium sp. MJ21]MEB3047403.1 UbiA family prenyltransferase [Rhizobium sp. MJ21]
MTYLASSILLGLVTALCIACASYCINEWFDRAFDRHHPTKSQRSAVQRAMNGRLVQLEWTVLLIIGLGCAILSSKLLFFIACLPTSRPGKGEWYRTCSDRFSLQILFPPRRLSKTATAGAWGALCFIALPVARQSSPSRRKPCGSPHDCSK